MALGMIILSAPLVLAAHVAAPGPENWAYLTCITSAATETAEVDLSEARFRQRLEEHCQSERATLRRLIVRQQVAKGRSVDQANADADGFFAEVMEQMLSLRPS